MPFFLPLPDGATLPAVAPPEVARGPSREGCRVRRFGAAAAVAAAGSEPARERAIMLACCARMRRSWVFWFWRRRWSFSSLQPIEAAGVGAIVSGGEGEGEKRGSGGAGAA